MYIILNLGWAAMLLPLVGIGAAFLAESPRRAAQVGVVFTGLALAVSTLLLVFRLTHYVAPYESVQTFWDLQVTPPAVPPSGAALPTEFLATYGIRIDALSVSLMTSVLSLSLAAQLHGLVSARGDEGLRRFGWVVNLLTGGLTALIAAPSLFQFFIGWEMAGVAAWMLATHVFSDAAIAARATRVFVLMRLSDLALLGAIALTYARLGASTVSQPVTTGLPANDPLDVAALTPLFGTAVRNGILGVGARTVVVIAVLLVVAAMVHAAVGPFHAWLTASAGAPLAGVALLAVSAPLSAAVLLARTYPALLAAPHVLAGLAIVGGLAAATAAVLALLQSELVRAGIFATVTQSGLVLAAFGMGGFSPALFVAFTAVALAALYFLVVANIAARYRSTQLNDLGGLRARMPGTARGLLVWTAASSGLSLAGYTAIAAALRNTAPGGGSAPTAVAAAVAALLVVAVLLAAVNAVRVYTAVSSGEVARRRGFDASRVSEVDTALMRPVLLAALAVAASSVVGIPGLNRFTVAGKTFPGLTFSHFVFFGPVRQVLAVQWPALFAALVIGVAGVLAGRRLAAAATPPRVLARLGAAFAEPTLSERGVPLVTEPLLAAATVVQRLDAELLEPFLDEGGSVPARAAELLVRARASRLALSVAASLLLTVVILGGALLAVTGHFVVSTR
ncbi:MAG: proton-conducting transporter transmembrane domain-containing protein [Candidatus Dormibacteria bacterium]